MDVGHVDAAAYPLAALTEAWRVEIGPGDILVMPAGRTYYPPSAHTHTHTHTNTHCHPRHHNLQTQHSRTMPLGSLPPVYAISSPLPQAPNTRFRMPPPPPPPPLSPLPRHSTHHLPPSPSPQAPTTPPATPSPA